MAGRGIQIGNQYFNMNSPVFQQKTIPEAWLVRQSDPRLPVGKGYYIWQIRAADGPSPARYVQAALQAGLSHVIIKFTQTKYRYNHDVDLADYVAAFQDAGLAVWGFHYACGGVWIDDYGTPHTDGPAPEIEADFGAAYAIDLGLDGYVINAEKEFKVRNPQPRAARFCDRLVNQLDGLMPIALSTYRYPESHPEFPFDTFIEICQAGMPQVYWIHNNNPAEQLRETLRQWSERTDIPIIPTGATFKEHGWIAKADEVQEFLTSSKDSRLQGCNFWVWQHARKPQMLDLWDVVADFDYDVEPTPLPDPDPDPEEIPCMVRCIKRVNLRGGPSTDYADVGDVYPGPLVFAVLQYRKFDNGDAWVQIGEDELGTEYWSAMKWQSPQDGTTYRFFEEVL